MEAAERRRAEATPRWQELQQQREKVASLESDLRLAEHRVNAAREAFNHLDRELVAANEAKGRLEVLQQQLAPIAALRSERQRLDELAGLYAKRQVAQAQLEETRASLQTVRTRAAKLPPADAIEATRTGLLELTARLDDLNESYKERRSTWDRDLQDARTKREALRDQYRDLKEQLDRITQAGPEGACPTCARPLGAEYDNVIGVLDRQMQEVLFNGNYYKSRIDQLAAEPVELRDLEQQREAAEKALADATAQLGRLQAQAQEGPALRLELARLEARAAELEPQAGQGPASYDPNQHADVRRQLTQLEPVALQAELLRAVAERGELLVADAETAERALSEREAEVRAVREKLAAMGYSDAAFKFAQTDWEAAERERREAELGIVRSQAERRAAEEAVQAVARRREERGEAGGGGQAGGARSRALQRARPGFHRTPHRPEPAAASGPFRDRQRLCSRPDRGPLRRAGS